jgi:2Fe-2S ferredoxin
MSETIPVQITPLGVVLHCHYGETLMQCAWRHGYYWPTICGGIGDCGACRCEVLTGGEHSSGLSSVEELFVRRQGAISQPGRLFRLACCMAIKGPISVFKVGVKPSS